MSAENDPKTLPRSAVDRWNRRERSLAGGEVPEGRANPLAWHEENAAVHESREGEGPQRILAMTDVEIANELQAAGVSQREADAGADAFLATDSKGRRP